MLTLSSLSAFIPFLSLVSQGSLPSNVGGASNVRNILRRVFALLHNKGWWQTLGMDGFLQIFAHHKEDLATIYGPFKEYKSFRPIIELEYERWLNTDAAQTEKLQKLLKKKGGGKDAKLTLDDWILCVSAWGVPADQVAKITGQAVPLNLYYEIASRQEKMVRATPAQLYATAHLPETKSLYYGVEQPYDFSANILEVMLNVTDKSKPNIVVLDRSCFYPTSGGQEHDDGHMHIDGIEYEVVDVLKVGPCTLHVLNPPLPAADNYESYKTKTVRGVVNEVRRSQLRNNHTATHIVYASCRKVLGPSLRRISISLTSSRSRMPTCERSRTRRTASYSQSRTHTHHTHARAHIASTLMILFTKITELRRRRNLHITCITI
jgi:alanyl-tRNA synthetase